MTCKFVPCVVFAFNRPEEFERVLAALKTQDIDHLIVFVDGPRGDADVELVERCRAIASDIDWIDTELYLGERNRGLPGLADNISGVLSTYKSAVFVEDDCLPMPGFYSFMRQALRRYESEKKVFSIGGYQPIPQNRIRNGPYSVVSSPRFTCWGWTTWRDRWELMTPYLSRYWELFDGLTKVPDLAGIDLAPMARACAEGRLESWAVRVAVSALWLGYVHLLPTRGLVQNIGLRAGTHGGSRQSSRRRHNRNVHKHSLERIVWLRDVELNNDYARELQRFVDGGFSLVSWIKRRLRHWPWLMRLWKALRREQTRLLRSRRK